jgi:hypothetical protein
LIKGLYSLQVSCPEEVINMLEKNTDTDWDEEFDTYTEMFMEALKVYLKRPGHPEDFKSVLGNDSFEIGVGDKTLRARHLLFQSSGSYLLPVSNRKVTVSLKI